MSSDPKRTIKWGTKTATKIETGRCCESLPCQHPITVYYTDGTKEDAFLSKPEIYALFKHVMTEKQLEHFSHGYSTPETAEAVRKIMENKYRELMRKEEENDKRS